MMERVIYTSDYKSFSDTPCSRGYSSVRWSSEQEKLYTMSTKYKFHNPDGLYFVSFAVKDWIDVFTRNEYKDILIESLDFCQKQKGLEVLAWCVMTNHVHLIIRANEGFLLENILRDFKRHTSKKVVEAIKENPQESRKEWLIEKFVSNAGISFGVQIIIPLSYGAIKLSTKS